MILGSRFRGNDFYIEQAAGHAVADHFPGVGNMVFMLNKLKEAGASHMKKGLNAIAADLRRAFVDRPVPSGSPREDVFDTAHEFADFLCACLRPIAEASNDLFDRLLPQDVDESSINAGVVKLHLALAELVNNYHKLWRRPFPPGMEMGQILLSAVFERLMRDYLDALEDVLDSMERAGVSEAEKPQITLEMRADEELARLQAWLEQTALAQRRDLVRSKGVGLGALAAAFGLGWLLGDGD